MKKVLKWIGIVLLALVLIVVVFFGVLTITEFKPGDADAVATEGSADKSISRGESLTIVSWNVGYGSLDENADFFMDGGTKVMTSTTESVMNNLSGIESFLTQVDPDAVFLQKVDRHSKRSHKIDEVAMLQGVFSEMETAFAYNFKTLYVPYPLPTIGRVESGILTMSKMDIAEATRVKLPSPFKYPVRLANLKRCLLVSRVPLEGSDKELVLVNLHLEAYDSGEGKAAQTAMLKEILEEEALAGNYVIAGGDFNQSFSNIDSTMYPIVSEDMWAPGVIDVSEFGDLLEFVQDNSAPSCRSLDKALAGNDRENFQYYLIDGFIVSSNVNVQTITTADLGFANTDHNPVVMEVILD